jgi:hypothetical protein
MEIDHRVFFLLRRGKSNSASAGRTTPWSGPRKNADAKKYAEQQAGSIACVEATRRCSISLRGKNASFEECFDLAKLFGDHGTEFPLMWSHLKRGVYEETPFAFSIIDRMVDYLGKELLDGLFRRQRRLQPVD